jgi:hypothetical protein
LFLYKKLIFCYFSIRRTSEKWSQFLDEYPDRFKIDYPLSNDDNDFRFENRPGRYPVSFHLYHQIRILMCYIFSVEQVEFNLQQIPFDNLIQNKGLLVQYGFLMVLHLVHIKQHEFHSIISTNMNFELYENLAFT